ncbi:unnamed protein product [Parajaminaea phylloscopi]
MPVEDAGTDADLQTQLETLYCPPLDPSLVAAIANDEGQTLRSAKEVLDALAGELTGGSASPGSSQHSDDTHTQDETAQIQRLLDEVHLAEQLDQGRASSPPSTQAGGVVSGGQFLFSEAGPDAGNGTEVQPYDASKHGDSSLLHDLAHRQFSSAAGDAQSADELTYFLQHAFPTRTREFLAETLTECGGDLGMTVDTLMAIDVAERQEADAAARESMSSQASQASQGSASSSQASSSHGGGLDYDALARVEGAKSKGKRARALRKKAHEDHLRSMGAETGPTKDALTKVVLGDVRQGGRTPRTLHAPSSPAPPPQPLDETTRLAQQGLSDYEIACRLAKAEDPEAGEPVKDNQWLLSSSILSQLADLLDVDSQQISSAYNRSGFNLHIAVGRLVDASADTYPSLDSLDAAGSSPAGTAESIVRSLASLAGKGFAITSLCLRATKGRQDATLDLLNLLDVVRDAAGGARPDELDPLGKLRHPEEAATPAKSAASTRAGVSVDVRPTLDPRPGEAVDFAAMERAKQAGAFSRAAVAGRNNALTTATGQDKAMASLREGAQATVSFPPSAAQVNLEAIPSTTRLMFSGGDVARPSGLRTIRDREVAIARAQELASDYQAQRNRCLVQASTAWRSSPTNRGAAFYYADEARRLEAKSRQWSLRAAEELVAYRRAGSDGDRGPRPGVIDLHGVTVREALSIVNEELNSWWSKPGRRDPLTIITGAGRHSPNQVSILTPSVAKYLQREQWRADVDRTRGVIVVRGR